MVCWTWLLTVSVDFISVSSFPVMQRILRMKELEFQDLLRGGG